MHSGRRPGVPLEGIELMNAQPLLSIPDTDQTEVGSESERLLVSGAPWKGVLLDLYGTANDEDGYDVCDVALKGSRVSLAQWFSAADMDHLTDWCNEHLPTCAELRAQERAESMLDPFYTRH
jgi:hypothetical protein